MSKIKLVPVKEALWLIKKFASQFLSLSFCQAGHNKVIYFSSLKQPKNGNFVTLTSEDTWKDTSAEISLTPLCHSWHW